MDPPLRRPLFALALAVALGAGLGAWWVEAGSLGCWRLGMPLGGALAWAVAGRVARRRGARAGMPWWIVAAFLLAAARSVVGGRAPGVVEALPREVVAAAREGTLVGRWRCWSRGMGWVEPVGAPSDDAPRLLLRPQGRAPREGAWVAVLPGSEVVPWPRGPVPAHGTPARFHALSPVRPDELVHLAPGAEAGGLRAALEGWREAMERRLARWEADGAPAGRACARGLPKALLFGHAERVDEELVGRFTRTGTRHLLAVSGLHVGLVAALVVGGTCLVARLRGSRRLRAALQVALLAAYAVLAGAGEPVVRAGLAFALGLAAPLLPLGAGGAAGSDRRRADPLSLWSFALLCECLADADAVRGLSLQLSYLAVLGILVASGPLRRRVAPGLWGRTPAVALLPGPGLAARIVARRAARALVTALAASVAAVLFTLPVAWSAFGEWSPVGIVATPLALPFVAWILALAVAALVAPGWVDPAWARVAADGLAGLLAFFDRLPGTPTPLPARPEALVALATLLAVGALLGRIGPRAAALAWGVLLLPWRPAPRGLELHALEVGGGTCVALRAPGLGALVFDAGSRDRRRLYEEALAPLLASWEVRRPVVIVSHDHADHLSALATLVERYPPRLWAGALTPELRRLLPRDCPVLDLERGRVALPLGPASTVRARLVRGLARRGNEGSRALELGQRGARVLLTGDAEGEGLARVLRGGLARGPLRLLLFPHHGSDTPHLARLLEELAPEEVWVSCASPPAVGAELDRRGVPWRWTGGDGPLTLAPRGP